MINKNYWLLFLVLFYSCKNNKKNIKTNNDTVKAQSQSNILDSAKTITNSPSTSDYQLLSKKALNGNEDAYDELFYIFMDSNKMERTDSLMIYAKVMAEKFNYKKAYLDYFKALCEKYDIEANYPYYNAVDLSKMPEDSKKVATKWLNKMLEKKIITKEKFDSIKK